MQVECIRAFGNAAVGDVVEVPDGAQVDPVHWREVTPPSLPPGAAEAARAQLAGLAGKVIPGKEGM